MATILYVDDERENLVVFETFFKRFYRILTAISAEEAYTLLNSEPIDLILTDQKMPGTSGTQLLAYTLQNYPDIERILVTGYSDFSAIIQAINECRIFHYITKPWDQNEFKLIIERAIEIRTIKLQNQQLVKDLQSVNKQLHEKNSYLQDANNEIKKLKSRLEQENQYLKSEVSHTIAENDIIYESTAYAGIMDKVRIVAPTNSTVMITGETGTGNELIARAIHRGSNRKEKNFIKVNCAAIPANLIESELFGHIKGSFTGAVTNKTGLFELADRGTIFLDEIGELPLELQAKFLRVLQDGEFTRIGDVRELRVDVRVIAATNRVLENEVRAGKFRSDLFFRLNVFPIRNLSLRERKEDIGPLVNHFIRKIGRKIGKNITEIPKETMEAFKSYSWPGNIRELENLVERLMIMSPDASLDLSGWQPSPDVHVPVNIDNMPSGTTQDRVESNHMRDAEKNHIVKILERTNWRIRGKGGAAELLNLKPTTLSSKMKKLGIQNKRTNPDF